MAKPKTVWFVYMLECRGGKIYTGIATDVAARFEKHRKGKGAAYTRANKPLRVIATKRAGNRSKASKLEARLKQLERPEKLRWALKFSAPVGLKSARLVGADLWTDPGRAQRASGPHPLEAFSKPKRRFLQTW